MPITADAKLALTEFLLGSEDVAACAQHGLDWLESNAGVTRALCAASVGGDPHLWGVAGIGISAARTGAFEVDPAEGAQSSVAGRPRRTNGVVRSGTLAAGDAARWPPVSRDPDARRPATAIARSAARRRQPGAARSRAGLVRACAWRPSSHVCARGTSASDRGLDRERRLLFSVINAVSDPILLTDAQGKLLMGNTRAEQLLAWSEETSEGRRHALELNNLHFSSALAGDSRRGWPRRPGGRPGRPRRRIRSPVRAPEHAARSGARAERVRLGPAQRHRSGPRDQGDRRQLQAASRGGSPGSSGAPAHRAGHPLGRRSDHRQQRRRKDSDDESSGRVALHGCGPRPAGAAACARECRAVLVDRRAVDERLGGSRSRSTDAGRSADRSRGAGRSRGGQCTAGRSELAAVVTVLHDLTEAVERERLYAELKLASSQLEDRVSAATTELATQNELLRRQAARARTRVGRQVAIPGQHLARVPHTAQRHPRLHVDAPAEHGRDR